MKDLSLDELLSIAHDILSKSLVCIRTMSWERPSENDNLIIGHIADATHNLPSAIRRKNKDDLKNYIAEFQCFLLALDKLNLDFINPRVHHMKHFKIKSR